MSSKRDEQQLQLLQQYLHQQFQRELLEPEEKMLEIKQRLSQSRSVRQNKAA